MSDFPKLCSDNVPGRGDEFLGFRVDWVVESHYADAKVYRIVGIDEPGDKDTPVYEDDWEVEISVKWDGCTNWATNRKCMAHFCGPKGWLWLQHAAEHVYRRAFELMEREPEEPWPSPS